MEDLLLDAMRKANDPFVIELPLKAADGKPAAVRCNSLENVEMMACTVGKFGGVPKITQQQGPGRTWSRKDELDYYNYLREIIQMSMVEYRAVDKANDNAEVWLPVKWIKAADGNTPRVEDGQLVTHIGDWDRGKLRLIGLIGNRVIRESNLGGPLSAFADVEFRSEGLSVDGEDREGVRAAPTRGSEVEA